MKNLFKIFIQNTLAIYLLSEIMPGLTLKKEINALFIAAVLLILFLNLIKPLVNLIMLPLNLITLNLTVWISDILLVFIWTIITPGISITAANFPGYKIGPLSVNAMPLLSWQVTLVYCILLILILKVLNWLCK